MPALPGNGGDVVEAHEAEVGAVGDDTDGGPAGGQQVAPDGVVEGEVGCEGRGVGLDPGAEREAEAALDVPDASCLLVRGHGRVAHDEL